MDFVNRSPSIDAIPPGRFHSDREKLWYRIYDLRVEYARVPFCIKDRAKQIGVSASSLSRALRGLSFKDIPGALPTVDQRVYRLLPGYTKRAQPNILLDNIVALRLEYAQKPFCIKDRAYSLGVGPDKLSRALRGLSYKNLPHAVAKL